jgi:hypothetical protein
MVRCTSTGCHCQASDSSSALRVHLVAATGQARQGDGFSKPSTPPLAMRGFSAGTSRIVPPCRLTLGDTLKQQTYGSVVHMISTAHKVLFLWVGGNTTRTMMSCGSRERWIGVTSSFGCPCLAGVGLGHLIGYSDTAFAVTMSVRSVAKNPRRPTIYSANVSSVGKYGSTLCDELAGNTWFHLLRIPSTPGGYGCASRCPNLAERLSTPTWSSWPGVFGKRGISVCSTICLVCRRRYSTWFVTESKNWCQANFVSRSLQLNM